jgi:hypothetical protein
MVVCDICQQQKLLALALSHSKEYASYPVRAAKIVEIPGYVPLYVLNYVLDQ